MKIGAHVSTASGTVTAFERAEAIGAETAQVFLTPPQQWRSNKVDDEVAQIFRSRADASSVGPLFVHGVYLINLATPDETNLARSTSSLKSALTELRPARHRGRHLSHRQPQRPGPRRRLRSDLPLLPGNPRRDAAGGAPHPRELGRRRRHDRLSLRRLGPHHPSGGQRAREGLPRYPA